MVQASGTGRIRHKTYLTPAWPLGRSTGRHRSEGGANEAQAGHEAGVKVGEVRWALTSPNVCVWSDPSTESSGTLDPKLLQLRGMHVGRAGVETVLLAHGLRPCHAHKSRFSPFCEMKLIPKMSGGSVVSGS